MLANRNTLTRDRYAITETQKAELDSLNLQVLNAKDQVAQLQSVVSALTSKSNTFSNDLSTAKNQLAIATKNANDLDAIVIMARNLNENSETAKNEVQKTNDKTKDLAKQIRDVMLQLIYTAEVINKLQSLIIRKKALNPLISDDIVSMITAAGSDANNAVALMLVALESSFTAQASVIEALASSKSESKEASNLYNSLNPINLLLDNAPSQSKIAKNYEELTSISMLIAQAKENAETNATLSEAALVQVNKQLNTAKSDLVKAEIKMQSLQAGLAAANAAALAS